MDFKRTKLLYGLIAKNQSLSKKRHPMFEKSTFMKFFIYIFMAFWAVYLFFLGIALYAGFEESSREPYDMINGGMIFLLALDCLNRTASTCLQRKKRWSFIAQN